jgi:hypothetical protein
MITEGRIKQIRRQLSKGEPEGEIKNLLRQEGYTEDEITSLFFNLFPKKTALGDVKGSRNDKGQIFILIGASFIIAGIAMLAVNTWLTDFGIPLIVLGAISICVKYFIAGKH